jgi:phage shock protein A
MSTLTNTDRIARLSRDIKNIKAKLKRLDSKLKITTDKHEAAIYTAKVQKHLNSVKNAENSINELKAAIN